MDARFNGTNIDIKRSGLLLKYVNSENSLYGSLIAKWWKTMLQTPGGLEGF